METKQQKEKKNAHFFLIAPQVDTIRIHKSRFEKKKKHTKQTNNKNHREIFHPPPNSSHSFTVHQESVRSDLCYHTMKPEHFIQFGIEIQASKSGFESVGNKGSPFKLHQDLFIENSQHLEM